MFHEVMAATFNHDWTSSGAKKANPNGGLGLFYTDDLGDTLAANGFYAHSKRLLSWSENPRS